MNRRFEIVVVGASAGGMNALLVLLPALPKDFPLPVLVVQHLNPKSAGGLAEILQGACALTVKDADDKETLVPGTVYLAPPDYHLLVDGNTLALSVDEKVNFSRPAVDVLFESAADSHGPGVIGVVLTGANADGARGAQAIVSRGGEVIVQDPADAEFAAMPQSTVARVAACRVLALGEIGPWLVEQTRSRGETEGES